MGAASFLVAGEIEEPYERTYRRGLEKGARL